MSTRKKLLWMVPILGAMFLAFFLVIFVAPPRSGLEPSLITVSFIGYTNAPDGQVLAQFALSNITRSRLIVLQPTPIVRTNGQWSIRSSAGRSFPLGSRQQCVISVPKPTNVEAWRLPVDHGRLPSLPAVAALRICQVLPWKPAILEERLERAASILMRCADSETRTD